MSHLYSNIPATEVLKGLKAYNDDEKEKLFKIVPNLQTIEQ